LLFGTPLLNYYMLNKGKFIVIDGTDGSGKTVQTKMLADRLMAAGFAVEMADFPQYEQKSAGLVEEYLSGKYGPADEVGPYRASIFYACDRYDANFKIRKWLNEGKIVISNRYVTANMGHQGGKIHDALERQNYFDWLYKLEYELFGIPKPDLNIILHVPAEISQKLADTKAERGNFAGIVQDIHEVDLDHLKNAENVYTEIARNFPDFKLIECVSDRQILPREAISDMVWLEAIKIIDPDYYIKKNLHFEVEQKRPGKFPNFKSALENKGMIKEEKQKYIKVERLSPTAKLPSRAYAHDAGLDIYADDYFSILPGQKQSITTGIRLAIPEEHVGLIWDKSGVANQAVHTMAGVIDSGYRGELKIIVINLGPDEYHIAPGKKIAQMLVQKVKNWEVREEIVEDETERSIRGFGSSGLF
jgi:dTMP kinase